MKCASDLSNSHRCNVWDYLWLNEVSYEAAWTKEQKFGGYHHSVTHCDYLYLIIYLFINHE